jgi:transcription-repair coupling factor (superfamily II helicase)
VGSGVSAPRIRDLELVQMVADLLLALDGKPQGELDITALTPPPAAEEDAR